MLNLRKNVDQDQIINECARKKIAKMPESNSFFCEI